MPLKQMSDVIVKRAVRGPLTAQKAGEPGSRELLATIGAYIPTDVATAYIAAAGGIATVEPAIAARTKFWIAVGVSVIAAFATWVLAHGKAASTARAANVEPPSPGDTLAAGWFEIIAAAVASFVWATAMPQSWFSWGPNVVWAPAAVVFVTSLLIGGLATLLNRKPSP